MSATLARPRRPSSPVGDPPSGSAAVVVTHDTRDEALACLATLVRSGADEIVLVDSGSRDGTVEAVADAFPTVRTLRLANVGFGRAANVGVASTAAAQVVVCNADTRLAPGGVAAMAGWLDAHGDVGALGPLIRYPDGRIQPSARTFPSLPQAIGHALLGLWWPRNPWTRAYRLTDWDHRSEREVGWLSGSCLALRREAFDEVGGFDPAYFMFVEDVDLCARLADAGWRVVFAPVTEVTHAVGASTSRRPVRMTVEHARSLDRFFSRRYADGPRRLLRPLIRLGLVAWVLLVSGWSLLKGRTHAQAA